MPSEPDCVDEAVLEQLRALGGAEDPGFLPGLVREFLAHAHRAALALDDAVRAGDAAAVRATAHGLKGSAASLGAGPLASLCAEVERAALVDGAAAAGTRLGRLAAELERVRQRFQPIAGA